MSYQGRSHNCSMCGRGRAYLARALTRKASVSHVKDVDLTRHDITMQKVPTMAAVARNCGNQAPNILQFHERPRQCLCPTLHERNQKDAFEDAPLDCTRSGKFDATFSPRDGSFGSVDRRRSPLEKAGIHHWRAWLRVRCEFGPGC